MFLLVAIPVFAVVFVLSYYYLKNRRPTGFPPGPPGYPFIGNLNLIFRNKRFHQSLHQLTKTYGEKIFGKTHIKNMMFALFTLAKQVMSYLDFVCMGVC